MKLAGRTRSSNSHCGEITAVVDGLGGKKTLHRLDPDLEIAKHVWSDEAVRGLLEEWLVPVIVDHIIRDLLNSGGDEVK